MGVEDGEQDFDTAFDQAVATSDGSYQPPAPTEEEEETASSEGEPVEEETSGEEDASGEGEETSGGEDTTAGAGGDNDSQQKDGDRRQYTDEELAEIAQRIQGKQQGQNQQGGEQDQGQEEDGGQEQQASHWMDYIPEDKREMVQQYENEWPEVAEAEQLKRDAQLKQMQDNIYSQVGDALAPIAEMHRQMQVDAHQQAIQAQHPDVEDIKDDLVGWVQQQPDFVRPAFEQVLQSGSAQEVNQLIDHYKQASGKAGAGAETTASSARQQQEQTQQRPKKEPSQSARKATAAAPKPKRTQPPKASDPEDFDSAFEEAAGLK